MKHRVEIVALFLLSVASCSAFATATTHIWGPSTDVQPFKKWHITSDMYLPVESDPNGVRLPTVTNVGLTVGVLPFQKLNLEIGVDHKTGFSALDRYPLYVNAKLGAPEGAIGKYFPAVAAGIFDVGTKSYSTDTHIGTNFDVLYAKVTKTVGPVGRFSVGYFSGNKDLLLNEKGEKDNIGLLAAWERTVNELSDKLWLCVEYMGSNSAYGTFNAGASWKFSDNVVLLAGYDVYNNDQLKLPNTFTLQVDIDFDFPGSHK
jgi:hypothetical protein